MGTRGGSPGSPGAGRGAARRHGSASGLCSGRWRGTRGARARCPSRLLSAAFNPGANPLLQNSIWPRIFFFPPFFMISSKRIHKGRGKKEVLMAHRGAGQPASASPRPGSREPGTDLGGHDALLCLAALPLRVVSRASTRPENTFCRQLLVNRCHRRRATSFFHPRRDTGGTTPEVTFASLSRGRLSLCSVGSAGAGPEGSSRSAAACRAPAPSRPSAASPRKRASSTALPAPPRRGQNRSRPSATRAALSSGSADGRR